MAETTSPAPGGEPGHEPGEWRSPFPSADQVAAELRRLRPDLSDAQVKRMALRAVRSVVGRHGREVRTAKEQAGEANRKAELAEHLANLANALDEARAIVAWLEEELTR